jgi:hypothetical protein
VRKLLLIGGCLAVAALGISACGDSESDEDKITSVVEASATLSDPADCEALNTVAFMEQSEFEEGQEAVESCEASAEDTTGDPESVTVSEVKVDGSSATAEAALVGGTFDGQTLEVGLVEEDGDWKVNQFERFVVFDREKLLGGLEQSIEEESEGAEDEEISNCLLEELEAASDGEVEEAILSPEAFVALAEDCVKA